MKSDGKSDCKRRRVDNIVEVGDDGLVYIRLNNGKKYLLNGDGCWRCGSTADCFGNMDDNELEMICEFDFYDEVRSLFLVFLKNRVNRLVNWLSRKTVRKGCSAMERNAETVSRVVEYANAKRREWAEKVFNQMKSKLDLQEFDKVFFHAGKKYREHLMRMLEKIGVQCKVPLKHLGIGKQKAWYKEHDRQW